MAKFDNRGAAAPRADGQRGSHPGRTPGQAHRKRHGTGDSPGANALRKQNRRLKKKIRKVRQARRRDNKSSVTAPLTDRRLNREVKSSLDMRYGGQLRDLGNEIRGSENRQNVEIPGWFQNWQNQLSQLRQQSQAGFAGAQQAQLGAAEQGFQRTTGQINQLQGQAAQGAAVRGSTPDQQPFQDASKSAGFQQLQGQLGAAGIGREGAIANQDLIMQQLVGAQKMLEALKGEGKREGVLRQERRGVKAERGAAGVDLRRQIRGDERQWQAVQTEFGLDVAKERNDTAQDRANRRQREKAAKRTSKRLKGNEARRAMEADRRYQLDLDKFGADRAKDNYQKTHGLGPYNVDNGNGKGKGGPTLHGQRTSVTPSERRGNSQSFRVMIRRTRSGTPLTGSPDPLLKKAASQYVYWEKRGAAGVTSAAMQRKLWKEYGIRMPVSSASGKRSGSRTRPGPPGQGPRPN